jgi:hypothetical protein
LQDHERRDPFINGIFDFCGQKKVIITTTTTVATIPTAKIAKK